MRDLEAVDRQLAEFGIELDRKRVRAMLEQLLGSDRSLARLNELLDGFGPSTGTTPRPAALLRDPLAAPGARSSPRPVPRSGDGGELAEARKTPRSDPPPARPNPPGVRGSLPPRIVSPLAPVQGDSLKTATPWPPVNSASGGRPHRDTLVDAPIPPPAPPPEEEPQLDAAMAALFGITGHPAAVTQPPVVAAPEDAPLPAAADAAVADSSPAPEGERAERRSSRSPRSTLTWGIGSSPPAAEPAADQPAVTAPPAAPRPSTRELLEQELDPRDFPSSHPPRARSSSPPLRKEPPPPAVEAQDNFEMLIDDSDDDIMELDDVELEEIE